MPINIIDYSNVKEGEKGITLKGLCEDEWEMPSQIEALGEWLSHNQYNLPKGSYIADIGFSPRPGASGDGAALTLQVMKIMVSIGMELFLSEYPEFLGE